MEKQKEKYVPPTIEVMVVEMEQGIAVGSLNDKQNITEKWDLTESDESSTW